MADQPADSPEVVTEGQPELPQSLNPESPYYQPWAEKLSNASKEKRPLAEFLAELDARLEAEAEPPPPGRWEVLANERFYSRFSPTQPKSARRRRRRPGSRSEAQPNQAVAAAGKGPGRPRRPSGPRTAPARPAGPEQRQSPPESSSGSAARRRRRRRPRGGRGSAPPTAG